MSGPGGTGDGSGRPDEGSEGRPDGERSGEGRPDDAPTENLPPVDPPTRDLPPVDPPTENLPPVEGGPAAAAWSQYPDTDPSAGPETGGGAPPPGGPPPDDGPPPGDVPPPPGGGYGGGAGDEGWDDDRGAGATPWAVAAALLAIALVAGLIVWLVNAGGVETENAAPTTTVTSTTPTSSSTSRSPSPTTSGPPGVAERCSAGFVSDEVDSGADVIECDGRFLLAGVGDGALELYTWRDEAWTFLAAPDSDVCREQLEELGVPSQFRRVFTPCDRPTSSTSSSSSSSTSSSPTTTASSAPTTTSSSPPTSTDRTSGTSGASTTTSGG